MSDCPISQPSALNPQLERKMTINCAKIFNRHVTLQSQPIPGSNQVPNSGGGYS